MTSCILQTLAIALIILAASGPTTRATVRPLPPQMKSLGPDVFAGRMRSVLFHPTDINIIYVGAASGGVWKTTDRGQTWASLDDFMPTQVIGSLAMDPNDPNTIYAGTGEIFTFLNEGLWLRGQDRGQGIFVSRDAGASWKQLASTACGWLFVSRIAIDPGDSNRIFAATESGLYRSTDGGRSFDRQLLGVFLDVKFHPLRQDNVVATALGNLVHHSRDAGANWLPSTLPAAVPADPRGRTRIELAPAPMAGVNAVWTALHITGPNERMVLLTSNDGGESFTFLVPGGPPIACTGSNGLYTGALWVDPRTAQKMLVGGVKLCRTTDGGTTFVEIPQVNFDFHAIVAQPGFDGGAADKILLGFDQGLRLLRAYDSAPRAPGLNNGLRTTQFHSAVGSPVPELSNIVGGLQDRGVLAQMGGAWQSLQDGDGTMAAAGRSFFYFGKSIGRVFRSDANGGNVVCISRGGLSAITESDIDSECIGGPEIRGCPNKTPMLLDPNDENRLYVGCPQLWRTVDAAAAPASIQWTSVKPASGNFNINAIEVPKGNANLMWLGTLLLEGGDVRAGGQLWKTTDATAAAPTFTQMDVGKGLPARPVFDVVVDPRNNEMVYASYSGFAADNVWKTSDGGTSWMNIAAGLPAVPVWSLAVHPVKAGWLYAGTDIGLYTSTDDGATWSATTRGTSTAAVADLQWKGSTNLLIMATYGRGVHEFDATPNPERLAPEILSFAGKLSSGRVENLIASDDKRLVITSVQTSPSTVSVMLKTRGGFTTSSTPAGSDMEFFIEASTSATATQKVEFFDFLSNRYVLMQEETLTANTENTTTRLFRDGASRFINPTREIQARVTWTSRALRLKVNIDAAGWLITRP